SQAITDAIVTDLRAHGATLTTGRRVRTLADVPHARALLLDLPAGAAAQLLGARLPARRRRALRLFGRAAGAAAKVDLVVRGPIPWACPDIGRAGTVHLGGTAAQIGAAERDVARGRLPSAPVVLVSDPAQIDPSRARPAGPDGDLRPVWAYAHVPLDCPVDPTRLVLQQIERAAPGFTDTVVAARGIPAAQMAEHNPALLGGDIAMGSTSLWGMVARPRAAWDPYRLDGEGTYLCSAATPPGPGVHGMGGMHAARRALRQVFGIRDLPPLSPLPGP
ncbi:MAG: NAD(P)/FAD-dependent oxidoreductase, partial [Brachybacterium sp.]|nr:NAD(P)/FAD-dependent oxidoreductase [Brachybacterium sp.]